VVRHIGDCAACREEVEAMRYSLRTAAGSEGIEPSAEWTAGLLAHARRQERRVTTRRITRPAVAAAAALLLVTVAGAYRIVPTTESGAPVASVPVLNKARVIEDTSVAFASEPPAGVALLTVSVEEEVLGAAVLHENRKPANSWEAAHIEAIRQLDADIEEGLQALKANPGLVRARMLVNASREQKRELLKALYLERSL
jgi:hypothetical protein